MKEDLHLHTLRFLKISLFDMLNAAYAKSYNQPQNSPMDEASVSSSEL
jgi:hypothetical protein